MYMFQTQRLIFRKTSLTSTATVYYTYIYVYTYGTIYVDIYYTIPMLGTTVILKISLRV